MGQQSEMNPVRPHRRVRVIVAGAGLAGLTAARCLERAGASVTVVEARDRVGGRVRTLREGLRDGQHVEMGADLIEEDQTAVLELAREFALEPVRILRSGWGFYGTSTSGTPAKRSQSRTFEQVARLLAPEIEAYKKAGSRHDTAVAAWLGRQSVAEWLQRVRAGADLAAGVRGLRGFFLADPEDLSLLPLVEQFAGEGVPGASRMYRLRHGNDTLPRAMADALRGPVLLGSAVVRVAQRGKAVQVTIGTPRRRVLTADFIVVALPASTLRRVAFVPALPAGQRRAIGRLRYGPATRIVLQFDRRFWKRFGLPAAYGSDQPFGAVWDGNEQQSRHPGILTLLAGGRAAREVRGLIAAGGWPALVRQLAWLGRPAGLLAARSFSWYGDRWSRGGYAVFDPGFDPGLRPWLARPAGRVFFAGEHTSLRWQGYMNGAVESGRRAAVEVAVTAGLDYAAV